MQIFYANFHSCDFSFTYLRRNFCSSKLKQLELQLTKGFMSSSVIKKNYGVTFYYFFLKLQSKLLNV